MKKRIVFAALILILAGSAYAQRYDGTVLGGHDGSFTRNEYSNQVSIDLAREVIIGGFGRGTRINRLFQITDNNMDAQDNQMINDHWDFLERNFRVRNNDGFSYFVKRTSHSGNIWSDGWLVFSHYSSSQGWLSWVYYFEISQ